MSPRYSCETIQENITAMVDGEADQVQCELVQRHFEECPDCREEYESDCRLKALVRRSCACESAPAPLREKILQRLSGFTLTSSSTTVMWTDGENVAWVESHTTTLETWDGASPT